MRVGVGTVAAAAGTRPSDAQLVALTREGDEAAFEELYRRYAGRLRGFVSRRVGDAARAEDLTQEAFIAALRALRSSEAEIAWKPWLFEIARNLTIDFHRRRVRGAEELSVEQEERLRPLDRLRLVGAGAPEAELAVKERLDRLRAAFDELPAQDHRVLVMRELEGRSYREIAEGMKLTLGAVESSLFRGRRRLELEYEELAAGRRCIAARAEIALLAEGVESAGERRRLARHARRCSSCRRHARELGVEPFAHRRLQRRVAGFLPLGWLVRRSGDVPASHGQLGAGLAERATALVAAGALACAGGAIPSASSSGPAASPRAAAVVAGLAPAEAPGGGATVRPRGRRASPPAPRVQAREKPRLTAARHVAGGRRAATGPPTPPRALQPPAPLRAEPLPVKVPPQLPELSVNAPIPAATPSPPDASSPATATVDAPAAPAVPATPQGPPAPGNVGQALPG